MSVFPEHVSRRHFLSSTGAGVTLVLSGCASTNDNPQYERTEINKTTSKPRTANEMVAAEAVAQQDPDDNASPINSLTLHTHTFTVKEGYKGPTVEGTVINTGEDLLTYSEVRVHVYDDTGAQLGLYLDSTSDLGGGTTWQFEVVLLTSVSKIASYDLAVFGIPG